jgi:hypothetical protein
MASLESAIHIVFTPSAVGELRDALRKSGQEARVISLHDCFSFGPINPVEPEARRGWVEEELGYTGWEDVVAQSAVFWNEALDAHDRKVAWTSRRSAQEFTGFLEWLWRLGDLPCEIVDLTDIMIGSARDSGETARSKPAISVGLLYSRDILANDLIGRAEKLTPDSRERYRELWSRLRTENAPLRVVADNEIKSAPLTFFDPLLLSHAKSEWQKSAMVIGKALAEFLDTSVIQTGDLLLASRLCSIVDAGLLEARGDMRDIRHSDVRTPSGNQS